MIFDFYPYPLITGLLFLLVLLILSWRKRHSWTYLLCLWLFGVYLLIALNLMFFPVFMPIDWPAGITLLNTLQTLSHINWIPFHFGDLFSASRGVIIQELAGNILLTLPLGFALPFLTRVTFQQMGKLALLTGLALEGTQLLMSIVNIHRTYGHSVDVNDVLLNTLGVLLGYFAFRLFAQFYQRLDRYIRFSDLGLFGFLREVTHP